MSESAKLSFEPPIDPRIAYAEPSLEERLEQAVEQGVRHLLSLQAREGYWLGELQADTTLESDYIFYLHVLGKFDRARVGKLANYLRRRQQPDGGWNIYEGGPSELNATVKAYVALRLAGDAADAPHMLRACERVRELGGLESTNSFTRLYLALSGAVGWDMVPAIPPELMLLPTWFYLNLYEMSSWTRAIVVPLTILYARKPRWNLPEHVLTIDELYRDPGRKLAAFEWGQALFSWRNFFLAVDRALKLYERLPWKPMRERALEQARQWMLERLERSDGLGAIYPAMMNSVFALLALGHSPDDPLTAREIGQLARFEIEEGDTIRLQPCLSPVWDTAISMVALAEAGLPPDHPALVRACKWMMDHQILGPGDWQVKNPEGKPGGWAFEFRNDFCPDVDDTAFVLMALQRVAYPDRTRLRQSVRSGLAWMVSMQNRDGGWGAFDRNNDCHIFTQVPFADHNAMIDPSTADVTARVVECFGRFGWPASHPMIKRALAYLIREQEKDGSWFGRWGVNYVYGTGGVLRALETVGQTAREYCQRGVSWLKAVQNSDGGWGESITSYYDANLKGRGDSTPSQTAWGLIGLLAAVGPDDPAVRRAVEHLVSDQNPDGSWDESAFTGTGFPCVFYLKYHLYRNYFPLYALARYQNLKKGAAEFRAVEVSPDAFERRNGARGSR
jgi:squalene-hopene/tetraprenyl-beta-curcumene cyclase